MPAGINYLKDFDYQRDNTLFELIKWVNINSWSENPEGLALMCSTLKEQYSHLGGEIQEIQLTDREVFQPDGTTILKPTGSALQIKKHPEAKIQIFLGGHMDTVYSPDSGFLEVEQLSDQKFRGPGITDMKGGVMVILKALELLEGSPWKGNVGWEVFINPDEEVGSPKSQKYLEEISKRVQNALLFEPAFPDGALVSGRKGSANFSIIAKGKAAHSGRDFFEGRNALTALAKFALKAEELSNQKSGLSVNIGVLEGGEGLNIVAPEGICRVNVRMMQKEQLESVQKQFEGFIEEIKKETEVELELISHPGRAPKPFDEKSQKLFQDFRTCAGELGRELTWRESGGVCDGNIFAACGVPTIDSLGVRGGNIHTHDEYMNVESLFEQIQLTALYLIKLASGEIK